MCGAKLSRRLKHLVAADDDADVTVLGGSSRPVLPHRDDVTDGGNFGVAETTKGTGGVVVGVEGRHVETETRPSDPDETTAVELWLIVAVGETDQINDAWVHG